MSSDYPRQNGEGGGAHHHTPPPFPQSARSRPESPRVVPNADDYLLGSPQWQNVQSSRALTPLSTAPSSPILPAHQRPFYGGQSAAPSTEFLLPGGTSSRGSSRNDFHQFNFQGNNPYGNSGNHSSHNNQAGYNSYDHNGYSDGYNGQEYTRQGDGGMSYEEQTYGEQGYGGDGYSGPPRAPYENWSGRSTPSMMSRNNPFATPNDWDAQSIADDRSANPSSDNMNTLAEKFSIDPSSDLLIYPNEVEADDAMHNPDPKEAKKRLDFNIWTKRGLVNLGALFIMVGGLLFLFIGYPVLTFVRDIVRETGPSAPSALKCEGWACLDYPNPLLLKNMRTSLIDKDTPKAVYTKKSTIDGSNLKLTFSDEFNTNGRTFYPGDDPYFEAMDLWYGSTMDLEWYDPDAVTTSGGTLNIRFDKFTNNDLEYRSGMLQSWNKLCFKGGMIEMSISLPGDGKTSGLWPGAWTLGNLARAGYQATTEGLWPYSYHDKCDIGITPNQSSSDGLSWLPGMRLPACTCDGEDHPSPGISRGAPEIDIIEATVGEISDGTTVGLASQSNQLAPFDIFYQPDYDFYAIYNYSTTAVNGYRGGPYQQAMSSLTTLNNMWYDGKAFQSYAFEYVPGDKGVIDWHVGEEPVWRMTADSVGPNGNIGQRTIAMEPMSIILNVGASQSFSHLDPVAILKILPATMRIDYIRIYQKEGEESITCDPEGYPTTDYIKKHPKAYMNRELLVWEKTGYSWPKNSFMNTCK